MLCEGESKQDFWNGKLSTSANQLLHNCNANTSKDCQKQLFSALWILPNASTTHGVFIQEKQLNLGKNKLYRVSTCLISTPFSSAQWLLQKLVALQPKQLCKIALYKPVEGAAQVWSSTKTLQRIVAIWSDWQFSGKSPWKGLVDI